jgi:hypothetical protein
MLASELLSLQLREAAQQRSSRDIVEPGYSGTGYWWRNYPAYISGLGDYNAVASSTGGSLDAIQKMPETGSEAVAKDAGIDDVPTGESVGGTAAY